ncbi:hypothetical protein ACE6H2_017032 [Prunus campanulata]
MALVAAQSVPPQPPQQCRPLSDLQAIYTYKTPQFSPINHHLACPQVGIAPHPKKLASGNSERKSKRKLQACLKLIPRSD